MFTAFLIYALVGWLICGFFMSLFIYDGTAEDMYIHINDELLYIFLAILVTLMITLFWPILLTYGIIEARNK